MHGICLGEQVSTPKVALFQEIPLNINGSKNIEVEEMRNYVSFLFDLMQAMHNTKLPQMLT